jgi:predicted nucleic acid-binding Zn ribbon protein
VLESNAQIFVAGFAKKGWRIVPTYQYRCGNDVEKTRPMPTIGHHMRAPKCPKCGRGTSRVFGAVNVGFRGGGLNRH